jgi:hypothetical protein
MMDRENPAFRHCVLPDLLALLAMLIQAIRAGLTCQ